MKVSQLRPTRRFKKRLSLLSAQRQRRIREALRLLLTDPHNAKLRLHGLKGEFADTYSISAGGDLRIHFELIEDGTKQVAVLQSVGTHSQLYR